METARPRVLIADSDPASVGPLLEMLREGGMRVELAAEAGQVLERVREEPVDLVIADSDLPPDGGMQLLQQLHAVDPDLVVILATGFGTLQDAVEAVREGAFDYLSKPLIEQESRLAIQRALERVRLSRECRTLREELHGRSGFDQFLARDPAMKEVLAVAAAIADTRATVLLTGESGTGKTLLGRAIHNRSPRRSGPFVELNCGALPETLLESELFGHVKGAFTGAVRDRPGKFEQAHGGTILLDEIATATPALQVKLLRVLQDRVLERVGDEKSRSVDVRVILATNVDLAEAVRRGSFREDLFYRVNVVTLEIPPLRDRPGDILHLARHFLERYAEEYGRPCRQISPEAAARILAWPWPGNVRELQNALERAVVLCQGPEIRPQDLPAKLVAEPQAGPAAAPAPDPSGPLQSLRDALLQAEGAHLRRVLEACGWKRTQAAGLLGIDRTTLFHKMRKHGLQPGSAVARPGSSG